MSTENQIPVIHVDEINGLSSSTDLANQIITALTSGFIDPLDFVVKKKLIEKALDTAMEHPEVKSVISDMLSRHPLGKAYVLGAEVSERSRTTIDYKQDHRWVKIEAERKSLEEYIKAATKTNGDIIDQESGEVIASPVATKTTTFFTVKLPK